MNKDKKAFIIGGGTSLAHFDFHLVEKQDTIVANKSIFHVPCPNYFITLDQSLFNKITPQEQHNFTKMKIPKVFVANFADGHLIEEGGMIVDRRWNMIYRLEKFNIIVKSYEVDGLGKDFSDFRNGKNSGYCALQLAIILGYEKIYLLGIDLKTGINHTHFHKGYGQNLNRFQTKLDDYAIKFIKAIKQIKTERPNLEIYSCSADSILNDYIPYKKMREIL